ncbi:shikimate dehydrogenase [Novosphingobium sp. Gsoil 351]|uniref:shikimate dehydrogenase family protein n=1 Tax=Novosphingobium sp. Gsoil 351 TaxID=2675225 RepID=UPI0018A8753D|nr:shikimate dehydrogenase [Novosphingobium sp. Gsoil 351]
MGRPYAEVVGDPIAHSKSPLIHNFWLKKLGIDAEYRACNVGADELADYFARRRGDADWRGCNITIPHKVTSIALVDNLDQPACSAGAVNTVFPTSARLSATNTDIAGILAALPVNLMPAGSTVCILGTGGAARAAFAACKRRGVATVYSSARNHELGSSLLDEFGLGGCARPLEDPLNIQCAEVIINATSLGMSGKDDLPQAIIDNLANPALVVFDMVYAPLETELLKAAHALGLRTVDGLAMLIGQAAAAFEKFFGQPAPREHDAELRALLTA